MLSRGLPLGWGKDAKRFDGVLTISSCLGEAVSLLYAAPQAVHVFRALVCVGGVMQCWGEQETMQLLTHFVCGMCCAVMCCDVM